MSLSKKFLLRSVNRVEEEPERRVRLAAVLRAKREQNRAALAGFHFHHCALAGDSLLAFEPAAQEHVARRIASDDARRRGAGLGRRTRRNLIRGVESTESRRLSRQPERQRIGFELEPNHR